MIYVFPTGRNTMRSMHVFVALLVLLMPLSGCIGDDETEEASFVAGEKIPDLTAPNQYGQDITISDMEGTMLVLLINAGGWCPPCERSAENSTALIQEMEAIDERYNVSFIEVLRLID